MPRLMPVLVLVAALCIVAVGLLGSSIGIVASLLGDVGDVLPAVTLSVAFLTVTVSLGLALAWHAWRATQGQHSLAFQPVRVWPLGAMFVTTVIIGHVLLSADLLPVVTFPFFHVCAAVLPPLILLALVGRIVGASATWRQVVLQTSSGAFISTILAFALEAILILGLVIVALAGVAVQPGGQELLQTMATRLQDPLWLEDLTNLAPLAESPVVVVTALLLLAGIVPAVEEAVKTVGIGLLAHRRPGLSQAFLWGVASGAGFALVEASFNTTSGLDMWALVILLRVGATLLHCFAGGLMGIAWYRVLANQRWGHGLGLYAASVAVHALWNGLTTWMALGSLATLDGDGTGAVWAGLGLMLILALLALLAIAVGLGLLGLALYVRRRSRAAGTPEPRFVSEAHTAQGAEETAEELGARNPCQGTSFSTHDPQEGGGK